MPNKVPNKIDLDLELGIEKGVSAGYTSKPDTVSIISLIDGNVKITGTVTGNLYIFPRAGTAQDVDVRDKDEILNKKKGRACCGGQSDGILFQLA